MQLVTSSDDNDSKEDAASGLNLTRANHVIFVRYRIIISRIVLNMLCYALLICVYIYIYMYMCVYIYIYILYHSVVC